MSIHVLAKTMNAERLQSGWGVNEEWMGSQYGEEVEWIWSGNTIQNGCGVDEEWI